MKPEIIRNTENRLMPSSRWWNSASGILRSTPTRIALTCVGIVGTAIILASTIGLVSAQDGACAQVITPAYNEKGDFEWWKDSCLPSGYSSAPYPDDAKIPEATQGPYINIVIGVRKNYTEYDNSFRVIPWPSR